MTLLLREKQPNSNDSGLLIRNHRCGKELIPYFSNVGLLTRILYLEKKNPSGMTGKLRYSKTKEN